MGGPKALLRVGGVPLVQQHVRALVEAGAAEVVVLVRLEIEAAVADLLAGMPVVLRACSTASPWETLKEGLHALRVSRGLPLVVTPVDLRPVQGDILGRLLQALGGEVLAVTPRHLGKGGHPVVVHPSVLDGTRGSLREALEALGARRLRIDVDDPHVLEDFDTPADVIGVATPSSSTPSPRACSPGIPAAASRPECRDPARGGFQPGSRSLT